MPLVSHLGRSGQAQASTQRNRALKHLAKLDREVAAMKSERAREQARNRKIQEREGHAAEEEEHSERRRLSVFSASARRKRAAGHLVQVEKKHPTTLTRALRGNWSMITPSRTKSPSRRNPR